jgi:hypothetical protein
LKISNWSRPVERRYSKTPLFLSYTNSITTGSEKRRADSERRATDRKGKLFIKLIDVLAGLAESAGTNDNMLARTTP